MIMLALMLLRSYALTLKSMLELVLCCGCSDRNDDNKHQHS